MGQNEASRRMGHEDGEPQEGWEVFGGWGGVDEGGSCLNCTDCWILVICCASSPTTSAV